MVEDRTSVPPGVLFCGLFYIVLCAVPSKKLVYLDSVMCSTVALFAESLE